MTPQEIYYCDLLFNIIDCEILSECMTDQMYHQTCNLNIKCYLDWLLKR